MYNENEPFAIRWLEQLQERNLIPGGKIDGRSITELRPEDCDPTSHFFAGIGGWAYALQLAGWDPARDVWTGSCPCQPFSIAGKGTGTSDKRHLWPIWLRLIAQYRPSTIFGEQTSSKLGRDWLSGVRTDLEALGYAVGAADLCAAGVNAPHRRQRLYWVAHTRHGGDMGRDGLRDSKTSTVSATGTNPYSCEGRSQHSRLGTFYDPTDGGKVSDTTFWDQFDIAECRAIDDSTQYRRIEPGLLPVVDGLPSRLRTGLIKGYGNAIVPQLAATFIRAFLEAEEEGE